MHSNTLCIDGFSCVRMHYAFTCKFGNFTPKKERTKFNSIPIRICMWQYCITYCFAVIATVTCLYLCVLYMYVCVCACIHFHFATNEPRIYVLWIFFEFEFQMYTAHSHFCLPSSASQKAEHRRIKRISLSFVFFFYFVCKFQCTKFDGGNFIDFSIIM